MGLYALQVMRALDVARRSGLAMRCARFDPAVSNGRNLHRVSYSSSSAHRDGSPKATSIAVVIRRLKHLQHAL